MLASASSSLANKEKKGAAPIRHYKGVNDLDKVVLHEVWGSSAEVPVYHSCESLGMFRLPDPIVDPRCLPWCSSKLDFSVSIMVFPSPTLHIYVSNVSEVLDVCCSCFILMLQK
jgi:hypothetical protein